VASARQRAEGREKRAIWLPSKKCYSYQLFLSTRPDKNRKTGLALEWSTNMQVTAVLLIPHINFADVD